MQRKPLDTSFLTAIAARYGIAAAGLSELSGGYFAAVYGFHRQGQDCILRVTPPDEDVSFRSTGQILEWLAFLSEHGGPVSRPIRSLQGNLIEVFEHEGRTYLATAFEKAPGVLAEGMLPEDWSGELFQSLGRAIGSCHRIACQYAPPANDRRPTWTQTTNCFNPWEELPHADAALLEKRRQVMEVVGSLPENPDNYGLAHMDLHFGNFFVDAASQKVTFFDFDDCAYGWYVMDLAMLLFDVLVVYGGDDRERFAGHFLEHLLSGYRSQKTLDRFWITQFPCFLKLLEIGVYISLCPSYDPAKSEGWAGKFMPGRKERIEQDIPYLALDFEIYR
jgi:amicoumacin kinase